MNDLDAATRLDREIDGFFQDVPAGPESDEARLFAQLLSEAAAADPEPGFVSRLERRLVPTAPVLARSTIASVDGTATLPAIIGQPHMAAIPPDQPWVRPRSWLSTVAVVLLMAAATLVAVQAGMWTRVAGPVPHWGVATPDALFCSVPPRYLIPAPPQTGSPGSWLAGDSGGVFGEVDPVVLAVLQKEGVMAGAAIVAQLEATFRELSDCQAGDDVDLARIAAFYSDTYLFFALDMPAMNPPRDLAGDQFKAALRTLSWARFGPGAPTVERAWLLGTGQLAAIVRLPDSDAYLVVLDPGLERWLINELAAYPYPPGTVPAPGTPAPGREEPLELAAVTMFDILYVPDRLTVPAGKPVTLALTNAGAAPHAFVVAELAIDVELRPGETTTIEITVPPGNYTFFSDIPGQREAGMVGTMVAVEDGLTPIP
jgi:hypothetical protein